MTRSRETYVVLYQILDAPPILVGKLHHMSLQPTLGGIASDWLTARVCRGLVICTDPRRRALIGHLPRDIAVNSRDELVMKVFFFSIRTGEYRIDSVGVFGLVESSFSKHQ